jgi:hypothetical protein
VRFRIRQAQVDTPNTAIIEVFNLADSTAANVIKEFNYAILQAGYQNGRFGTIFAGNIKDFKRSHEDTVNSVLTIFAADGDPAIQRATVNHVLPAGTTAQQRVEIALGSLQQHGVDRGYIDPSALQSSPHIRDAVLFGMTVDELRDEAARNGARWSINDGTLTWVGQAAYAPGDIVVLNAQSELIGWPEQTEDGIYCTCLINPAIRLLQRIQLNNQQINRFDVPGGDAAAAAMIWLGEK